jgi:Nif-specific regulatory protein
MKEEKSKSTSVPKRVSLREKLDIDWERSEFQGIFIKPHKRSAKEIALSGDKYRMLLDMAKALNSIRNLDVLFRQVLDVVIKISRMERGYLLLLEEGRTFQVKAARDAGQASPDVEAFELPESIRVELCKNERPIYLADIERAPGRRLSAGGEAAFRKAIICFPLKWVAASSSSAVHQVLKGQPLRDTLIGLIYLEGQTAAGEFPQVDLEFVEALASQATIAIENARLYNRLSEDREKLAGENVRLRREIRKKYHFENIIGDSPTMQEVFDLVDRLTRSDVSVLIRGESGTGKELIAKTIHYNSSRAGKPFVGINCAALPETLLESELFGIERGVATGVAKRIGKFEYASGGTFFMDEIGNMSLTMQAKLLRVIEEREIERVGGKAPIPIDVRLIAATNLDLEEAVAKGEFREDLYYRLHVVPVHLPPLRERLSDIPLLAEHFLAKNANKHGKKICGFSSEAMDMLAAYDWPGNVRELENVIQRAVVMADGEIIRKSDIPPSLAKKSVSLLHKAETESWTVHRLICEYAVRVMKRNNGNLSRTAKEIGLDFKTLKKRLQEAGYKV